MVNLHKIDLHKKLDLLLLPHLGIDRYIEFLQAKFPGIIIDNNPNTGFVYVRIGDFSYQFDKYGRPYWDRVEVFLMLMDEYNKWRKPMEGTTPP